MAIGNINAEKKVVDITKDKNKNAINILKGTIISMLLTLILLTIYSALLSFTDQHIRKYNNTCCSSYDRNKYTYWKLYE